MKFKIKQIFSALILISFFSLMANKASASPLKLDVYQASVESFYVSSVLVSGENEVVLIDAQFTLSDAYQLVTKIRKTGKTLSTVYISHGDPDYYFGLEVITKAFPNVKVYASEETVKYIKNSYEKKLKFWGPKLGINSPKNIIIPEVLTTNFITVDGKKLQIIGLDKHPKRTFVWIPELKSVVGGVAVYGNVHPWIADAGSKAQRKAWLAILNNIIALEPTTVVPGHATLNAAMSVDSVKFTKNYLKFYEQALEKSDNSKTLIKLINNEYPQVSLPIALQIGAKVATKEMKW